jgi:hypothetical protein
MGRQAGTPTASTADNSFRMRRCQAGVPFSPNHRIRRGLGTALQIATNSAGAINQRRLIRDGDTDLRDQIQKHLIRARCGRHRPRGSHCRRRRGRCCRFLPSGDTQTCAAQRFSELSHDDALGCRTKNRNYLLSVRSPSAVASAKTPTSQRLQPLDLSGTDLRPQQRRRLWP